jgi:hypothetical protein
MNGRIFVVSCRDPTEFEVRIPVLPGSGAEQAAP